MPRPPRASVASARALRQTGLLAVCCVFGVSGSGSTASAAKPLLSQSPFAEAPATTPTPPTGTSPLQQPAADTPAPAPPEDATTLEKERVVVELTMLGLDYRLLTSDAALLVSFRDAVCAAVATATGVDSSDVSLEILEGSVVVKATLAVPAGNAMPIMQGAESVGAAVAAAVRSVDSIDAASESGGIVMLEVRWAREVAGVSTTAEPEAARYRSEAGDATARVILTAVGGVFSIILCGAVCFSCRRRHRSTREKPPESPEEVLGPEPQKTLREV